MSDDLVRRGHEIFNRGLPKDVRRFGKEAANEIERLEREHIVQANLCLTANQNLEEWKQRAEAIEATNRAVAVCPNHTSKVIGVVNLETGQGCLVCEKEAAKAQVRELREALEEVRTNGEWQAADRDWVISHEVYEIVCQALSNTKDKSDG